jgi:hypothetical protein
MIFFFNGSHSLHCAKWASSIFLVYKEWSFLGGMVGHGGGGGGGDPAIFLLKHRLFYSASGFETLHLFAS